MLKKFKENIYGKWSPTTKLFFWIGIIALVVTIIALVVTIVIFIYQEINQHNNRKIDFAYLEQNFQEIKGICSEKNESCQNSSISTYVFVDKNDLTGQCSHFQLIKEANISLPSGSINLWFLLKENITDLILKNLSWTDGKIDGAIVFSGTDPLDTSKRYIFDMVDYNNSSFIEILVLNNRIVNVKIQDRNGQEFSLSYDNEEPLYNWTYLTLTWEENKSLNLFINAKLASSLSLSKSDFDFEIKDWFMGSSHKSRYCLNGLMDEVYFWEIPLSIDKIELLYNHGKGCSYPFTECE